MSSRARSVTILDVAAEAGVSKSAVSRALAGQGEVSPEVRERVEAAAQKLGYVVNSMAQGLRTRTRILGAVLRDMTRPYYGVLATALEQQAEERDYRLITVVGGAELTPASAVRALRTLVSLRVDGIVLSSAQLSVEELVPVVARVPLTSVGRRESVEGASFISADDAGAGADLAAHLMALGHRRIAVLGVDASYSLSQNLRTVAMAEAVRGAGGEARWYPVPSDRNVRAQVAYIVGERWATAIMCPTDEAAVGALEEVHRAGLQAPRDLSVTGLDAQSPLATPLLGLTTFRQPVPEMGRAAIDDLVERLEDGALPREQVLRGELVVGRTTGPPPLAS
ncbi:LacI family DNA-binding transcriptional regulator [Microbacterium sp. VKM Ac-2870]|uniref:LacI family DNA-binding transcriptional regulator n=1 Tax=Microbacterium sp. VKM Ac-2870 TaxID=2783825 RepID=UPI00188AD499|nr:LacI family DNA-binding transcriptional regulator [Microbacterium sp. VKM Ac-2870]MBF4561935.1 LacI family DNA-binding transcriptional regulator [Microbacterium sp. VKM Ac-2870]